MIEEKQVWFYDFEVFRHYWLIVLKNKASQEVSEIDSDIGSEALIDFYNKHKNDIFVGFNSRLYDVPIWQSIMCGIDPYKTSKCLLSKGKLNSVLPYTKKSMFPINNYDCYDGEHSLKQLEAFMGDDIEETEVDFELDRELTLEEKQQTKKYCRHDVNETEKFFNLKEQDSGDFKAQNLLLDYFNLPMSDIGKSKSQLTPIVLGTIKQHTIPDEFDLRFPHTAILNKPEYRKLFEWYFKDENKCYRKILCDDKNSSGNNKREIHAMIGGIPHILGYGGLHGSIDNFHYKGIILCMDVASLYPSLMIVYSLLSRKVLNPKVYEDIKNKRIEFKKLKNMVQLALKLVFM